LRFIGKLYIKDLITLVQDIFLTNCEITDIVYICIKDIYMCIKGKKIHLAAAR